jgi:lipopolysaccharide export system protein LptA
MRKTIALLLALTLPSGSAIAAEAKARPVRNADQGSLPIDISADRLSADSSKNSVTFEGAVHAKQGDVTLDADRVFAEYSKGAGMIDRIVAEGNVRFAQPGRSATASKAVFYNLDQRIVLTGNTVLTQEKNVLRGETLTIDLKENRATVTGGEGGGRVSGKIFPEGFKETKEIPGK